jgi:hypothetical protein
LEPTKKKFISERRHCSTIFLGFLINQVHIFTWRYMKRSNFSLTTVHVYLGSTVCKGIHHDLIQIFCDVANLLTYFSTYKINKSVIHTSIFLWRYNTLKIKSIPVTDRGGLQGCEMLKIPHCLDNRLTDGGKVVSPTHWLHLYFPKTFISLNIYIETSVCNKCRCSFYCALLIDTRATGCITQ